MSVVASKKLLAFFTFSFLVFHQSLGSDDLAQLLKKYPTWSFEVKSVESLIQDSVPSFRATVPDLSETELKAQISTKLPPNATHVVRKSGDPKWHKELPASFDARDKWPECAELIGNVEDEGVCQADGPAMVASAASDRYCIFSNGTFKEKLSQEMLAGCAEFCTLWTTPWDSFAYIKYYGIPTGGAYKSQKGCLPYTHPPCKHDNASYLGDVMDKVKSCSEEMAFDHECPTKCSNSKYSKSLDEDRKKFSAWYYLPDNEYIIREDILLSGPVVTSIALFSDFFKHPAGIYWKKQDAVYLRGIKLIKLIGWGTENGTRYWLAVNSWDHWGPTKVFKIPRGIDYLWVESLDVMGGIFGADNIDKSTH